MTIEESSRVHARIDKLLRNPDSQARIQSIKSVLILSTLWYSEVIEGLKIGARQFFHSLDVPDSKLCFVDVPGALELPFAARMGIEGRLAGQNQVAPDLVVVLGCVQKGSTPHFDYVCKTAFDALMEIQLLKKIPMGYGILTVNDLKQAQERLDKGFEAAQAALFMFLSLDGRPVEITRKDTP